MSKSEVQKYSLKEELKKADEKYQGSAALLGMTVLSYPGYINSMRSTMFTSHLKQFVNLLKPEYPLVFTNAENVVGKHSSGYKQMKHDTQVYRKIRGDSHPEMIDERVPVMVPPPVKTSRFIRFARREMLCGKGFSAVSPIQSNLSTETEKASIRGKPCTL